MRNLRFRVCEVVRPGEVKSPAVVGDNGQEVRLDRNIALFTECLIDGLRFVNGRCFLCLGQGPGSTYNRWSPHLRDVVVPVVIRQMLDGKAVSLPSREGAPLIVLNHD